jgi:thiol:disulfide interchange protein DsbC
MKIFLTATIFLCSLAQAQNTNLEHFKNVLKGTTIKEVNETPIKGIYEIVMPKNVAYTNWEGRYMFFGHLFDMHTLTDLTETRYPALAVSGAQSQSQKIYIPEQTKSDAIAWKKGSGKPVFYVFTDINCVYCKRLDSEIESLPNFTAYLILTPILGRESFNNGVDTWCSTNRLQSYLNRKAESTSSCENPLERNLQLSQLLNIRATPTIVKSNGEWKAGALDSASLWAWLNQKD